MVHLMLISIFVLACVAGFVEIVHRAKGEYSYREDSTMDEPE